MTRKIQILRGTEAQNDAFTGAVGELTMDTTNNEIRIHDGSTVGGHKIGAGSGAHNTGDIFFTMRIDSALNGAVECNGGTYSTADFSGAQSIGNLLASGKIPYVSLTQYATLLSTNGSVGVFGWDGNGTTAFRVPSLNDIFLETGTAAQVGDYIAPGAPDITGSFQFYAYATSGSGAFSVKSVGAYENSGGGYINTSGFDFSAADSNAIYGNSNTIQPNAVRYRAMVQLVNDATDEAVATCTDVTSQVATNTSNIVALKTHELIAYQNPNAGNNYTWYRKYADGWVEQGGVISGAQRVNLPIAMSDANYCVLGTYVATGIVSGAMGLNPDSTGFYANTAAATRWYVSGVAA